jgi:hypothetical protein
MASFESPQRHKVHTERHQEKPRVSVAGVCDPGPASQSPATEETKVSNQDFRLLCVPLCDLRAFVVNFCEFLWAVPATINLVLESFNRQLDPAKLWLLARESQAAVD